MTRGFFALSTALLIWCLVATPGGAYNNLPSNFKAPPVAADYYREQNICPYLSIPINKKGGLLSVWSCNIPYAINYCGVVAKIEYDCCPGKTTESLYTGRKCLMAQSVWKPIPEFFMYYNLISSSEVAARVKTITTAVFSAFVSFDDSWVDPLGFDMSKLMQDKPDAALQSFALGRVYSVDMKNGMTIKTASGRSLRISIYSNNLMFVNCRMLVTPDLEAQNGIVHLIKGPIMGSFKTVYDALLSNRDTVDFAKAMPAKYKKLLQDVNSGKVYTVYAPNNKAWKTASAAKYSLDDLYANSITERMLCSDAITVATSRIGPTLLGEYIGGDCMKDTKRVIKDSCGVSIRIERADIMADNGVVHQLAGVLLPMSVRKVKDAIKCIGVSYSWLKIDLSLKYWTECDISLQTTMKYILLLPTDSAYEWFKNYRPFHKQYARFMKDKVYRCNTIKYHVLVLKGELTTIIDSYWNQIGFQTLYKIGLRWITNSNYYVKYRDGSQLYFEYGMTYNLTAIQFNLGYIFLLQQIITIPEYDCTAVMERRETKDLEIIAKMVRATGYDKELIKAGPHVLFLAPRSRFMNKHYILKVPKAGQLEFLRMHTIRLRAWGSDIGYFSRQTLQFAQCRLKKTDTKEYMLLALKRYLSGTMYIGHPSIGDSRDWSMVVDWNIQCWNGIVWVIDYPITCPPGYCKKKPLVKEDFDTYQMFAAACTVEEGVATPKEFNKGNVDIAIKNPNKCVYFKMKPRVAKRKWQIE